MMKNKKTVLYISYDGILDPLGQSQILPYILKLSESFNIKLLTFEKKQQIKDLDYKLKIDNLFKEKKIIWYSCIYDNLFFYSSIINIIKGLFFTFWITIFTNINFYHIRSYIPGIMIIFYVIFFNKKFIFDMRGFWIEERIDRTSLKKNSFTFIFFKKLEKILIKRASYIITLTQQSKNIIINNFDNINKDKISVIRTCVDTSKFLPSTTKNVDNNKIIFCYLGSTDTAYDINKVLSIIKQLLLLNKNVFLKIITNSNKNNLLKKINTYELTSNSFSIESGPHHKINKLICDTDVGIFYAKKNLSISASFPTKIAEYLSCGIPIYCNNFNEDVYKLVKDNNLGIISDFDGKNAIIDYEKLLNLKKNLLNKNRLRNFSIEKLSLEIGSDHYKNIYKNI